MVNVLPDNGALLVVAERRDVNGDFVTGLKERGLSLRFRSRGKTLRRILTMMRSADMVDSKDKVVVGGGKQTSRS